VIDYVLKAIVAELGPTGLLVVGLYFVLSRPLKSIAHSIRNINHELGEIITLLKYSNHKKD